MRTWPIIAFLFICTGWFAAPAAFAADADFSGDWTTTYGDLSLQQSGSDVSGYYLSDGDRCLVRGTVKGRRLSFTYREPYAEGEGWFDLAADGASFEGSWRVKGEAQWNRWTGERAAGADADASFQGLWNATYGPLRLSQNGNAVRGFYRMSDGRFADVSGTAKGAVLTFSYDECGVKGNGLLTLSSDGDSFEGTWKAADGNSGNWAGARMEENPGRTWLIVLEASWGESLRERDFAYGDMLAAYFARMQNVECRHRFFDDAESLRRACSEIPFLTGPVVVAIASHGSTEGLAAGNNTITAPELAACFTHADNLALLHFSSCLILAGSFGDEVSKRLPAGIAFPISGYTTSVDWGGSAVAEILYLDLILARGEEPADAAKQLVKIMPIAGDRAIADSPFDPLGFRFLPARTSPVKK